MSRLSLGEGTLYVLYHIAAVCQLILCFDFRGISGKITGNPMKCVYCDSPDIKAREIYRDSLVRVFPTNIPITPGHMLIVPKRHVAKAADLTAAERAVLFLMLAKVEEALVKTFGAKGFNVAWNEGECAGQSVPHFHVHVVPREPGDTGITEYEPRKFLYRPGSREASPEDELRAGAVLVKKNLKI